MKYCSTRGEKGLTFEEVLFSGYSKDGGLYMPESIPEISSETLWSWKPLSLKQLICKILSLYISEDEITQEEIIELVNNSFNSFSAQEVLRVHRCSDGLNILEMFHGPTNAFKDVALGVVGQLLQFFLKKKKTKIIILVGTSGDTGSAAIESVRGCSNIDIVVLFPKGRCSEVQERQMTTVLDENVHVFEVEGTSDDLDLPIKQCFSDSQLVQDFNLMSVNSINWGRIVAQIANHIFAYLQLAQYEGQLVEIVVPTGACGNITGGCIAYQMGLPIRLMAAVNENNIVEQFISTGELCIADSVKQTWSSAMDIQQPYNVERLLFLFNGCDFDEVKKMMEKFETNGKISVPEKIMSELRKCITESASCNNSDTIRVLKKVHENHSYLLCPHTATAVAMHYKRNDTASVPRICMATASPLKFPEALQQAGLPPPSSVLDAICKLETKCKLMTKEDNWLTMLTDVIRQIAKKQEQQ